MPTNNSPQKRLAAEHALAIDPEFRALCPTQSAQLERSLLAEGCRDDLVAWKATKDILDGHNRHPLCERHGLPFGVVYLDLPNHEACKRWILANQLARRNISALAASYFRGSRYLLEKGVHGGDHSNGEATSHVETLEISTRLADEYHVARATIFRDATFAAAVDAIASTCGHEAKQVILARDSAITRRAVLLLAEMDAEARQRAIEEVIENGKLPRRTRDGKRATITLPTEPKALAEKLVERLGPEACVTVVARVKKLLPRETKGKERKGEEGMGGRGDEGRLGDAEPPPLTSHRTKASECSHG